MGTRIISSLCLHVLFLCSLSFNNHLSVGTSTISPGQSISGNQNITSEGGRFELGFFRPGNSHNYYLGIWYKNAPLHTIVWVANRDKPISDPFSSKLQLAEYGNLVILDQSNIQVWSTESFSDSRNSTVAVLEDNGNLVLRSISNSSVIVWQSFDHPTDTWLPGAKLGLNKLTKERQVYFSWSSADDPKPGPFSLELDPNGTKQYFIMQNGNRHWTCGFWPGRVSVFGLDTLANNYHNMTYVSNEKENYFFYSSTTNSSITRFVMDFSGQLRQLTWQEETQRWDLIWSRPKQQCEIYALCGEYGACNQYKTPICRCLQAFEPLKPKEWSSGNHSHGCVRRIPLQCNQGKKDGFLVIPNIRLPANSESLTVGSFEECESVCTSNCSCTAFTYDGECLIWQENLLNIQYLSFGDNLGKTLHLRLAMQELIAFRSQMKRRINWAFVGAGLGVASLSILFGLIIRRHRISKSNLVKAAEDSLVFFEYSYLRKATKNFSEKLGEGGFGTVFKGTLSNSTAVAVKRLKCYGQAEKQFRSEVSTIGTIHHMNLIHLRGFSVQGKEKFLVYDYMPNGSLEAHLFNNNNNNSVILDWKRRYQIALGIARGLTYLHEKCRDCIIHCDIKPENILLDVGFNPKVSDFGLAKLLGRDFSRVLTTLRGTRGYLAPEWISGEAVTSKVDIFSYGMLLFEIISGRRNRDISEDGMDDYLPARAAVKLCRGDEILSLLDQKLECNANEEELIRTCKVACWCIQDYEQERPSMGQVVQILEGVVEVTIPPIPRFLRNITGCAIEEVSK